MNNNCTETIVITIQDISYSVEVNFDYYPEERMTNHYPGSDEIIEILSVSVSGIDITVLISKEVLKEITTKLSKK